MSYQWIDRWFGQIAVLPAVLLMILVFMIPAPLLAISELPGLGPRTDAR